MTYPESGVVLLFFFLLSYFNFSLEHLCIIHNFSDICIMLLEVFLQSLSRIEILVWNIFAFFPSKFVDRKTGSYRGDFK